MEVDPFRDPSFYSLEPIKCGSKFRRVLRQADLFAQPVTFRYKNEKMFYTNFGAATSICIIFIMLGLLAYELSTMLSKSAVTLSTSSSLTPNKDPSLEARGGIFLFGYRLVNEQGQVFEDTSVVEAIFTTEEYSWNAAKNAYDDKTTQYYDADCETVFKEDVYPDPSFAFTSLKSEAVERI